MKKILIIHKKELTFNIICYIFSICKQKYVCFYIYLPRYPAILENILFQKFNKILYLCTQKFNWSFINILNIYILGINNTGETNKLLVKFLKIFICLFLGNKFSTDFWNLCTSQTHFKIWVSPDLWNIGYTKRFHFALSSNVSILIIFRYKITI